MKIITYQSNNNKIIKELLRTDCPDKIQIDFCRRKKNIRKCIYRRHKHKQYVQAEFCDQIKDPHIFGLKIYSALFTFSSGRGKCVIVFEGEQKFNFVENKN